MVMVDIESNEMLGALIKQDDTAFKALVRSYHKTMLSLARSIVGDSVADEVVQEAWVSVYDNLPKFEGRSGLKTWIYRITTNKAISRRRKESRTLTFSELSDDNPMDYRFGDNGHWQSPTSQWHMDSPEMLLTGQELRDCIEKISRELPELQYAVFILRDVEGKTVEEICNTLEITASNMRVLLHRARVRLFEHVDHFLETGEC